MGRRSFAMVVAAEGAYPIGGQPHYQKAGRGAPRPGGIAAELSEQIYRLTTHETRTMVLGHLQRGGSRNAEDHLLALRFGTAAENLVRDAWFGYLVALDLPNVLAVPLSVAVSKIKMVPLDSDVIQTARSLGTCLGD